MIRTFPLGCSSTTPLDRRSLAHTLVLASRIWRFDWSGQPEDCLKQPVLGVLANAYVPIRPSTSNPVIGSSVDILFFLWRFTDISIKTHLPRVTPGLMQNSALARLSLLT